MESELESREPANRLRSDRLLLRPPLSNRSERTESAAPGEPPEILLPESSRLCRPGVPKRFHPSAFASRRSNVRGSALFRTGSCLDSPATREGAPNCRQLRTSDDGSAAKPSGRRGDASAREGAPIRRQPWLAGFSAVRPWPPPATLVSPRWTSARCPPPASCGRQVRRASCSTPRLWSSKDTRSTGAGCRRLKNCRSFEERAKSPPRISRSASRRLSRPGARGTWPRTRLAR